MKKRILSLALASVMVIGVLAGCGKTAEPDKDVKPDAPPAVSQEPDVTVPDTNIVVTPPTESEAEPEIGPSGYPVLTEAKSTALQEELSELLTAAVMSVQPADDRFFVELEKFQMDPEADEKAKTDAILGELTRRVKNSDEGSMPSCDYPRYAASAEWTFSCDLLAKGENDTGGNEIWAVYRPSDVLADGVYRDVRVYLREDSKENTEGLCEAFDRAMAQMWALGYDFDYTTLAPIRDTLAAQTKNVEYGWAPIELEASNGAITMRLTAMTSGYGSYITFLFCESMDAAE